MTSSRIARSIRMSLAVAVTAMALSSCADGPTAPSNFAPFSQSDVVVGAGGDAVAGKLLTVNYTGWFYSASGTDHKGVQFETSLNTEPFTFTLGAQQVITGWDQGLPGMRVGGKRRLIIPPSLAYGGTRSGLIPPNATLVFEIDLLEVQ